MTGLDILMMSHEAERVHSGLVIATTTAALGRSVRIAFMGRATVLMRQHDWQKGLTGLLAEDTADLRAACPELGIDLFVCDTGLKTCGMKEADLDQSLNVTLTNMPIFLAEGFKDRQWLTV